MNDLEWLYDKVVVAKYESYELPLTVEELAVLLLQAGLEGASSWEIDTDTDHDGSVAWVLYLLRHPTPEEFLDYQENKRWRRREAERAQYERLRRKFEGEG